MGIDINHAREVHFTRIQKALEEGLREINNAKTPAEAEEARIRAQQRLEKLNRMFADAFGETEKELV